ncbi:MAG: aldehyde dehydrogenase (NADP(+)), partial [Planctomycetota bacterium]
MPTEPVLINNEWRPAQSSKSFHAINPQTRESLSPEYPVSDWADCDAALNAAAAAAEAMAKLPPKQIADFLN